MPHGREVISWRRNYKSILLSASAIRMADTIVTRPGRMKLWLSSHVPVRVVPV